MLRIGIFIHLFLIELFDEFKRYIENVKKEFENTTILFTLNDSQKSRDFSENIIKKEYPNCHIIFIENKGVDIYAFFQKIQYSRKNNFMFDYILKIHSKNSNLLLMCKNWRKELIEPITDADNLKIIHDIMKKKEIGYFASQLLIFSRNFDIDIKYNFYGIYELTQQFPHISENYIDFIAGTMFWINYKIIENNINQELMNYFTENMSYEKPPHNTSEEIIPEYVFERLITGPLCFNYTNVLLNSNKLIFSDTNNYLNNEKISKHFPHLVTFHKPSEIMYEFYNREKNNLLNLIKS